MNTSFLIYTALIGVVLIGSVLGTLYLSISSIKSLRKYKEYMAELKKQNKYEEWAIQHNDLMVFEKVNTYVQVIFLIALLLFAGGVKEVIEIPQVLIIVSGILVWLFWPYQFIAQLIFSRYHKRVLGSLTQ